MTSQLAEGVAPSFTDEEKAYFENRGNVPASSSVEEPDDEPMDLVDDEPEGDETPEEVDDEVEEEEEQPEKPKKQVVPIKALHKEREARRQYEQQLQQEKLERVRLEERMNALLERFQPQQQAEPEEPVPSFEEDPFAAMQAAAAKQQSLEQQLAQFQEQQRQQAEAQQIAQYVQYHEQEFIKTTPDYNDAVQHLRGGRINELQMLGLPPQQVQQIIQEEAQQIIFAAAQSGKSPAELAYTIAKQRGYAPKSQQVEPPKPSTKSLSQASGSPTGAKLTAQDVLRMSPEEFERFASKNPKKFRQLMGG